MITVPSIHALRDGNVSGAIIDCWENEPNIDLELLKLVDIATPHIAGYSADGKWNATKMSLEQLSDFFQLDVAPRYQEIPAPTKPLVSLHNVEPSQQLEKAVAHLQPGTGNGSLESRSRRFLPLPLPLPLRRNTRHTALPGVISW